MNGLFGSVSCWHEWPTHFCCLLSVPSQLIPQPANPDCGYSSQGNVQQNTLLISSKAVVALCNYPSRSSIGSTYQESSHLPQGEQYTDNGSLFNTGENNIHGNWVTVVSCVCLCSLSVAASRPSQKAIIWSTCCFSQVCWDHLTWVLELN